MLILLLGLLVFLGVHSVRIAADGWRSATIARVGELPWKAVYAVLSLIGLVLIVWGFSLARQQPVQLWMPPRGMRHLAALLTLIAFVLLAATYVPRNAIKARLHHPMVLSVKVWALAHLLANGNLAPELSRGAGARPGGGHGVCRRHHGRHAGHGGDRCGGLGAVCLLGARRADRNPAHRLRYPGQIGLQPMSGMGQQLLNR